MNVSVYWNNKKYDLAYNKQSDFFEVELSSPDVGGVFSAYIKSDDGFGNINSSTKKIQVLAREKKESNCQQTLVYFLDKTSLEIKEVIEFKNYEYVIDEETNKNTIFEVMQKINAENSDIVVLQKNKNIDYIGKIKSIENENGQLKRKITLEYISNIFDRKILLENENLISDKGIEDFISQEIYNNFTNSDDEFANITWLDVEVKTHTKIIKSIENDNGIYNFHTFVTNCSQNYNIIQDYSYSNGRIKLTIYKQKNEIQFVDATISDISNYVEKFETTITSKVVVKTDSDVQTWYLLDDRTTTKDKNNVKRVYGEIETIYTSKSEDAEQTAMDKFKANVYNHYISFDINRKSKILNIDKFKIGTPVSVRTKNNVILNTYISKIFDKGNTFISVTCGNIRVEFIDNLLKKERRQ